MSNCSLQPSSAFTMQHHPTTTHTTYTSPSRGLSTVCKLETGSDQIQLLEKARVVSQDELRWVSSFEDWRTDRVTEGCPEVRQGLTAASLKIISSEVGPA